MTEQATVSPLRRRRRTKAEIEAEQAEQPATNGEATEATEPAEIDAPPDPQRPPAKSLYAKLARIMGEMAHIPKEGYNRAQNYKFVRETDVAERASALLAAQDIWINQHVLSHKRKRLYTTQSGLTMWLTTVEMEFSFVDGDTGETTGARMFVGTGADTGDKGIYKAMTGAEKYFLMKSFLVSTGDDPEADEKVDKTAAAADAANTGVRVTRGRQPGVQRGGRSARATTAQIGEIARLARDAGLDAEGVVIVAERITGTQKPEDKSIRDWLSALTSEQAGQIVAAMSAGEEGAVVEAAGRDADEIAAGTPPLSTTPVDEAGTTPPAEDEKVDSSPISIV